MAERLLTIATVKVTPRDQLEPCGTCTVGEPATCGRQYEAVDSSGRFVVVCSKSGVLRRIDEPESMSEEVSDDSISDLHPDVKMALVILSHAKEEAGKQVRGSDSASVEARKDLIRRILEANSIHSGNGHVNTNREAPEAPKTSV